MRRLALALLLLSLAAHAEGLVFRHLGDGVRVELKAPGAPPAGLTMANFKTVRQQFGSGAINLTASQASDTRNKLMNLDTMKVGFHTGLGSSLEQRRDLLLYRVEGGAVLVLYDDKTAFRSGRDIMQDPRRTPALACVFLPEGRFKATWEAFVAASKPAGK